MNNKRRLCLQYFITALALNPFKQSLARQNSEQELGNFNYIYSNDALRNSFLDFYRNVFHLYPEDELHALIATLTKRYQTDEAIYKKLQQSLADIKPFLADLRYALPALAKQKQVMTQQTKTLLDTEKRYDGYMEVGTTGRYLGSLEEELDIQGEQYLLHTKEAGYSPVDIIERGQLSKNAQYVNMGHYSTEFTQTVGSNSLDLVTVYIGFHHSPLDKRAEFIEAIRDVLKPGGQLVLRDHDAKNRDLLHIAALAHDTFNAGTHESWQTNQNEIRNFYSLEFIIHYLGKIGLKYNGKVLFQAGDPTKNGLMSFTKV